MLDFFSRLWGMALFRTGDATVYLNQVVIGFLMGAVGIWALKRGSRMLHYLLLKQKQVPPKVATVIEMVIFYLGTVVLVFAGLDFLGIPLSVFAFLGGAVAIGLGFGAQNILNNTMSGLILLFEKPIRRGDLIQVEGNTGYVKEIGFRCTLVRQVNGIDVLVPNSKLLENNLYNWTLRDRQIRGHVRIGFAYGSNTQAIKTMLHEIVEAHEKVETEPKVIVVFEDFGDNALIFDVFFWATISQEMELKLIQSDVRTCIDQRCHDEGIVIAFPQRDVHLDVARPIPVTVRHASDSP